MAYHNKDCRQMQSGMAVVQRLFHWETVVRKDD